MNVKMLLAVAAATVLPGAAIASIAVAGLLWGGGAQPSFALDGLPETTTRNYHFVESHPELAERIPCYCGCGDLGHASLLDCYLRRGGGYEPHASGCGICGMEADDIEQMLEAGETAAAIRAAVDAKYSTYGKPTDTPGGF